MDRKEYLSQQQFVKLPRYVQDYIEVLERREEKLTQIVAENDDVVEDRFVEIPEDWMTYSTRFTSARRIPDKDHVIFRFPPPAGLPQARYDVTIKVDKDGLLDINCTNAMVVLPGSSNAIKLRPMGHYEQRGMPNFVPEEKNP